MVRADVAVAGCSQAYIIMVLSGVHSSSVVASGLDLDDVAGRTARFAARGVEGVIGLPLDLL